MSNAVQICSFNTVLIHTPPFFRDSNLINQSAAWQCSAVAILFAIFEELREHIGLGLCACACVHYALRTVKNG